MNTASIGSAGSFLIRAGVVDAAQLVLGLDEQARQGTTLGPRSPASVSPTSPWWPPRSPLHLEFLDSELPEVDETVVSMLPIAMSGTAIIDWAVLSSLRVLAPDEYSDLAGELVALFRRGSAGRIARLRDAMTGRDIAAIRREAHSLCGSAGLLGAAARLERCSGEKEPWPAIEAAWPEMTAMFALTMAELPVPGE